MGMDELRLLILASLALIIVGSIVVAISIAQIGGGEASGGFVVIIGPIPIAGSFGKNGPIMLILTLVLAIVLTAMTMIFYYMAARQRPAITPE